MMSRRCSGIQSRNESQAAALAPERAGWESRYSSVKAVRRKVRRAKDATRRIVFASERRHVAVRRHLAGRYLRGDGLEVGALHLPLALPRGASARYVDRMSVEDLRAHYPELDEYELVTPDFIDDGEALTSVPGGSMDFVIVNHLIEHCQDPIGALLSHARVLREGGILYLAAPDRRRTDFDREREETSLEHLLRDHEQGPEGPRSKHYEEWSRFAIKVPGDEVSAHAASSRAAGLLDPLPHLHPDLVPGHDAARSRGLRAALRGRRDGDEQP